MHWVGVSDFLMVVNSSISISITRRVVVHAIDSQLVVFDPPDEESPDFYYRGVKQSCK
jgi:hypothetical protein